MAYATEWHISISDKAKVQAELRAVEKMFSEMGNQPYEGFLYRFKVEAYAGIQPYADPVTGDGEWYTKRKMELQAFPIKNFTNTGATIYFVPPGNKLPKHVRLGVEREWASVDIAQAFDSYIQRRTAYIRVLQKRMSIVEEELRIAKIANGMTMPLPKSF